MVEGIKNFLVKPLMNQFNGKNRRKSAMKVFQEFNITIVEKEILKEFLNERKKGKKVIILGAQEISDQSQQSRPRAYAILKNLEGKKFLEILKGKGFMLTSTGEQLVNEIKYRENVLKTFFLKNLNFSELMAEEEASALSIYVSTYLIEAFNKKAEKRKSSHQKISILLDNK